eukprot:5885259-Amphidinium_carterae.1
MKNNLHPEVGCHGENNCSSFLICSGFPFRVLAQQARQSLEREYCEITNNSILYVAPPSGMPGFNAHSILAELCCGAVS